MILDRLLERLRVRERDSEYRLVRAAVDGDAGALTWFESACDDNGAPVWAPSGTGPTRLRHIASELRWVRRLHDPEFLERGGM